MYVKLGIRFDAESAEPSDIGYKAIHITPKILVSIQITNKDKKVLWKNNITLTEFSEFAAKSDVQADPKKKRKAVMITPLDIYNLYKYALMKLLETYQP